MIHEPPLATHAPPSEAEVLGEEARRHHRRKLLIIAVVLVSLTGLVVGVFGSFGGSPPPGQTIGAAGSGGSSPAAAYGQSSSLASTIARGRASVPWVVSDYNGTPFGDLAVAPNGTLYFIDLEYGQIDELTSNGARILLSSLSGGANPNSSIPALSGLFVTSSGLYFAAESSIFEATLSGRSLYPVSSGAFGVTDLDVLGNGATIYFATSNGVYERTGLKGTTTRVAGGGNLGPGEWSNGKPATESADQPHDVIGLSPSAFDYTTDDNQLDLVRNGALSQNRTATVDFFNGEMTESPDGTIYAICGWSMCRIDGANFTPIFRIPTRFDGDFEAPSGLAIAPNGDFYESFTNQSSPNGKAGIAEMSPSGRLLRLVVVRNQHVYG